MSVAYVCGVVAAAISPFSMSVGFIMWGKSWTYSAYSLNLFKCSLAGLLFLIVSFTIRTSMPVTLMDQQMIMLSSLLGIIIGDNTWLLALKRIGAKKVIVIDTLKPLLAALLAYWMLQEQLSLFTLFGIVLTTVGIIMVSIDKESSKKIDSADEVQFNQRISTANDNNIHSTLYELQGYFLAAINVILDAFGSVITKLYASGLNTWEINFLRFGFAAVVMGSVTLVLTIANELQIFGSFINLNNKCGNEHNNTLWYEFPRQGDMTTQQWFHVTLGVMFVTFICPALSNYALFQIPLALCLTLTSLGPVYSVPLVYFMNGERTGLQGLIGALLSVVGVSVMFIPSFSYKI